MQDRPLKVNELYNRLHGNTLNIVTKGHALIVIKT